MQTRVIYIVRWFLMNGRAQGLARISDFSRAEQLKRRMISHGYIARIDWERV